MRKGTITGRDIKKLAEMAKLQITDEEAAEYPDQLTESLKYVENLDDLDTSEVPDTFFTTKAKNVMQDDEIDPNIQLSQKDVLKNAKKTKNGYFVVKRII